MIDAIDTLPETTDTPGALSLHVRDMTRYALLSAEEEAALFVRGQTDEAARHEFACRNLRLVLSAAKKYGGRGLPLEDCVGYGHIGLMRAMQKFDPARGCKFSTYALWWIEQAIGRAVDEQARLIRVPAYQAQDITRLKRAVSDLSQDGDEPSDTALLDALVAQGKGGHDWTLSRVQELRRASLTPASLDAPMHNAYGGHGGGTLHEVEQTLADILPDTSEPDGTIETRIAAKAEVARLTARLTDRERRVIELRYGLDGGGARSLEEVARLLHDTERERVCRERIRQIEAKALAKMRAGSEDAA